jgi:hypothetical protein
MFQHIKLKFEIWRLRRRIASQRQQLRELSMDYFTMDAALLRSRIDEDIFRLDLRLKELAK